MIAIEPNPTDYPTVSSAVGDFRKQRLAEDRTLQGILLWHLADTVPCHLPGTDGMRVEDVLHEYYELSLLGIVPTQSELMLRHPDLVAAIVRFFVQTDSF